MNWEDCVVDVHSVKLSSGVLETMFKKCGSVRSITHWKGQGEKPHIFFEYKSPSSADSARAIGLDRSDLQVIKISNNEMLKKKFRELAHGPLRERDQRCSSIGPHPRSTYARLPRDSSISNVGKDYRLSTKSSSYISERDTWGKHEAGHRDRVADKNVQRQTSTSTSASIASSSSDSRERYSRRDYGGGHEVRSESHRNSPSAVLHIPHAGEIINFNLDTQLEDNPTGIIRILSAVKADQKLWMITAAYYKGKHNLDSAKKVLEAGIDMAVQIGEESDTKPFWHLLSQINTTLQTRISPLPSTLNASLAGGTSSLSSAINSISSGDTQEHLRSDVKSIQLPSPPKDISNLTISSNNSAHVLSRVQASDLPALDGVCNSAINNSQESSSPPCFKESVSSISQRLTGPSKRETLSNLPPPSLTPPLDHMGSLAKVYTMSLQSEISVLHEKQNAVLEDLSVTRAAKRRAEDEVKEERSVRRKLEKHLRATEDALSRSKRMEDAALDQVRREVEARRKAEALLAEFKANKEQAELSTSGSGQSIFTSENSNNAAVLFHLASMIRGVPSSDRSASLSFGNGGPTASSRRLDDR